jgi:hypothetical protein
LSPFSAASTVQGDQTAALLAQRQVQLGEQSTAGEGGIGVVEPAERLAGGVDHGEGILAKPPTVGPTALIAHATVAATAVAVVVIVMVVMVVVIAVIVFVIAAVASRVGDTIRRGREVSETQGVSAGREKIFFHADSSFILVGRPGYAVGSMAVYEGICRMDTKKHVPRISPQDV